LPVTEPTGFSFATTGVPCAACADDARNSSARATALGLIDAIDFFIAANPFVK
jgi:hypothetical protein